MVAFRAHLSRTMLLVLYRLGQLYVLIQSNLHVSPSQSLIWFNSQELPFRSLWGGGGRRNTTHVVQRYRMSGKSSKSLTSAPSTPSAQQRRHRYDPDRPDPTLTSRSDRFSLSMAARLKRPPPQGQCSKETIACWNATLPLSPHFCHSLSLFYSTSLTTTFHSFPQSALPCPPSLPLLLLAYVYLQECT